MGTFLKLCYSPLNFTAGGSSYLAPDASFEVWYNGDFGLCFEYLTFSCFLGAVFCVISGMYAGCSHTKLKRKRKPYVLILRGLISLSILLTWVADLVGGFWLSLGRPYSVLLSVCVQVLAWSMHLYCLWVLGSSVTHHGRGPLNLVAAWLLTFVGSILQLRTTIRWKMNNVPYLRSSLPIEETYFSEFSVIVVYLIFSFQCLYAVSLVLKVPKVTGKDVLVKPVSIGKINQKKTEWTDDAEQSVREHLISSEWPAVHAPSSYGSVPHLEDVRGKVLHDHRHGNLDAVEDSINIFSCLSFWWVEPLMRRGALGLLRNPEDLLKLPASLSTSKIREKFRSIRRMHVGERGIQEIENTASPAGKSQVNGLVGAGQNKVTCDKEVDSDNESWYDSLSQHNVEGVISGDDDTMPTKVTNMVEERRVGDVKEMESVFWSLNRAFGLHFYPLGILKLLADMLGFAGPLLLHALVAFMENSTVSVCVCVCVCEGVEVGRLYFKVFFFSWSYRSLYPMVTTMPLGCFCLLYLGHSLLLTLTTR